jgi:polysaccharide deacetylase family protein (PEP-CTERM system associated)
MSAPNVINALTVDVEDYYHVSALAPYVPRSDWDGLLPRIGDNLERILDLLQSRGITATFFILGWVAERHPEAIRRLAAAGHEIASHGYSHVRATEQTPAEFRQDVESTKKLLEDLGGVPVYGYRAPSFSIQADNLWALDILREVGHRYSSSIYPIRHDLYGLPGAPRFAFRHGTDGILELPMTTVRMLGQNWPAGGGGFFRLFPYSLSAWLLRRVNRHDGQPCIFYFHPWELDPEQPRVAGLDRKARFRHYVNLHRTEGRLERLLADFSWGRMDRVFLHGRAEAGE